MTTTKDYLIIGAGPAGLQMGYFLEKQGADYLMLEAGQNAGTFFETYPRRGRLLTVNKIYTGYDGDPERQLRYDWNSLICDEESLLFRHYNQEILPLRDDFARYLRDFAAHYQLNIQYNTRVTRVSKNGVFSLETESGTTYQARRLLVAVGVSRPYIPPIPGAEYGENYVEYPMNPEEYTNQRVLIVGKGNSAFESANQLMANARMIHIIGPRCVRLAWSTHYKGDVRAINTPFIDTYHLKAQNNILNADLTKIERRNGELVAHIAYTRANGQTMELAYDRVLFCTGFSMDTSIFDESCKPQMVPALKNAYPAMTAEWESVNVPDMYFMGILMGAKDERKHFSSFVSGYRYNLQVLHKLLRHKYENAALPCDVVSSDPRELADLVLEQASRASWILLQPGFICDVFVVNRNNDALNIQHYPQLNVEYVQSEQFSRGLEYIMLTLEYGDFPTGDPLCIERDPDPDHAQHDVYVHPIIRHYRDGQLINEHHIPEVLENDWRVFQFMRQVGVQSEAELREMYRQRVTGFFEQALNVEPTAMAV